MDQGLTSEGRGLEASGGFLRFRFYDLRSILGGLRLDCLVNRSLPNDYRVHDYSTRSTTYAAHLHKKTSKKRGPWCKMQIFTVLKLSYNLLSISSAPLQIRTTSQFLFASQRKEVKP